METKRSIPEILPETRRRFTPPPAWIAFVDAIDHRTKRPVKMYGLMAVAMNHMTLAELDQAEALLSAYQTIAEHSAGGLDVALHQWATFHLLDIREGRWWHCERHGCAKQLRKRREAERQAIRWARAARGVAA